MERVRFRTRVLALAIDGVIVLFCHWAVLLFVLGNIENALLATLITRLEILENDPLVLVILTIILSLPFIAMEALEGSSPGKRIVGIQIRNADGSEAPLEVLVKRVIIKQSVSFWGWLFLLVGFSLFRWLEKLFSLVLFLGCLLALSSNRQTLHDILAKTAVFRIPPPEDTVGQPIGLTSRTLALGFDIGLVAVITAPFYFLTLSIFKVAPSTPFAVVQLFGSLGALFFLPLNVMEVLKGTTPGKNLLGIQIRDADGSEARRPKLLKRVLVKQSSGVFLVLSFLSGVQLFAWLALFTAVTLYIGLFLPIPRKGQCLHDKITKTALFSTE